MPEESSPSSATPSPEQPAPEPSPPPRLAVRVLGILLLLAVSGGIGLLVAELAVRVVSPRQLIQIRPDVWHAVDSVGWLRRPSIETHINTGERTVTIRTDGDGFRIGESGRQEGRKSILLLGDSFMEALQVEHEQTTAALLERRLAAAGLDSVVVRNAGVSGWSPNQYRIFARSELARTRYDLVIVAVFVGNDVVRARLDRVPPRVPVERRRLRFPHSPAPRELVDALAAPVNDALEVRSHLYILLKNQLSTLRMRLGLTADYFPQWYRRSESGHPGWDITVGLLRDLAADAAERGVPVIFALVPERLQVHDDDFLRYLSGFDIDPADVDLEQPSRVLRERLTAAGLTVVDALGPFRSAADSVRLYGTVDQHFTPEGHALLADLVLPAATSLLRR